MQGFRNEEAVGRGVSGQRALEHSGPPIWRRQLLLSALLAALILVLFGLFRYTDLVSRKERILRNGDRRAANLATILSDYMRQAFSAADATLRQLAVHSERVGGSDAPDASWLPILTAARAGLTGIGSISVVNRTGIIRHSTRTQIVGESRADDFLFRHLATVRERDGLAASTPYHTRLSPGTPTLIPLGRRLEAADGTFDGTVVATFIPDSLRSFFAAVDVGAEGKITVFHTDGVIMLRAPFDGSAIGKTAVGDPVFEHAARSSDMLRTPGAGNAPTLRWATVTLPSLSMIVAVALSEDELLANWRRDVIASYLMAGLLALSFGVSLALYSRHVRRAAAADLALSRARHLEALGQLTGGVAHDFNNLLSVILGYASLLRIDPSSPTYREDQEAVEEIQHASTRAAELTRQLLAFARRQPLQPRLVNLNELVLAMEPMLRRTLGEDVSLRLALAPGGTFARVDPIQLDTAILNLCVNARDAMPRGGLLLIETGRADLDARYARDSVDVVPGPYAMISVSDSGTGMTPEVLQHLFEPFFTTKTQGRGTGLGLSMVYGFVKQSGGHAKVYSEVGRGTVVRLYFPEELEPGVVAPGPPIAAEQSHGSGEVVLLVEDDPALRAMAARMLDELSYRVLVAADAATALDVARREPQIDVLLTDVVLPGAVSGLELAHQLLDLRPGIAVLFSSGYSEEILQHHTESEEPLHLLAKPYDTATLAAAVQKALARAG